MKAGHLMFSPITLLDKVICAAAQALAADDATPAKKMDRKFVIDEAHGDLSA